MADRIPLHAGHGEERHGASQGRVLGDDDRSLPQAGVSGGSEIQHMVIRQSFDAQVDVESLAARAKVVLPAAIGAERSHAAAGNPGDDRLARLGRILKTERDVVDRCDDCAPLAALIQSEERRARGINEYAHWIALLALIGHGDPCRTGRYRPWDDRGELELGCVYGIPGIRGVP